MSSSDFLTQRLAVLGHLKGIMNRVKLISLFAFSLSIALSFALMSCSTDGASSKDSSAQKGAPAAGNAASAKGASGAGKGTGAKGPGGPGGKARTVAVEGYIAQVHNANANFQTMATLEAMNSVELTAATSGRLVSLSAKDGANVQKGALLAKIDDSELKAQLKQAESSRMLAKQKLDRTKGLVEKNAATQADLEAAEASLKSADASIELIQAQIAKTEIRAPFNGVLGFVKVSVGAWITTGTSIATLSEVERLKAKFALPQRYASILKVGDAVSLVDEERSINKDGEVSALDATISESSRTRQILVTVDNANYELLAGGYAKVNVTLGSSDAKTIPVPAEALTLDKDGAYVYVVRDGKAVQTYVQTGLRTPIAVDVLSGLTEGDTVVSSGLISMRNGAGVRIKEIRNNTDYELD